MAAQAVVTAATMTKTRQGALLNIFSLIQTSLIHIFISIMSKIILYISFYSPPPKKTGRFEFSQNNHYLSDDYSDDEEEHLHSK